MENDVIIVSFSSINGGNCEQISEYIRLNERSQCFFQHHKERLEAYLKVPKKFIVVSNTERDNFIEAMTQHTKGQPEILFLSARHYGKVSIEGTVLESDAAKADLRRFLQTGVISGGPAAEPV